MKVNPNLEISYERNAADILKRLVYANFGLYYGTKEDIPNFFKANLFHSKLADFRSIKESFKILRFSADEKVIYIDEVSFVRNKLNSGASAFFDPLIVSTEFEIQNSPYIGLLDHISMVRTDDGFEPSAFFLVNMVACQAFIKREEKKLIINEHYCMLKSMYFSQKYEITTE